MNTDGAGCEGFEIAALRQVQGALDASASDRLERHLAACPNCRRFATIAEATGRALRRRTLTAIGEPERQLKPALAALRRRLDDGRSRVVRGIVVVAVIIALQVWSNGAAAALVVGGMAAVIVGLGIVTVVLPRRRQALAASATEGDLIAHLRADLDREIAGLRGTKPYLMVLGVLAVLLAVITALGAAKDLWLDPKPVTPAKYLVPLAVVTLVGFRLWYDARCRLPMLVRERESLS